MKPLIEAKNISKYFDTGHGLLHAVDNVSFTIEKGKTLGVVGESGCGKSTLARIISRLLNQDKGSIIFDSVPIDSNAKKAPRGEIQMIFQDPFSSLDPKKNVRWAIAEPLRLIRKLKGKALEAEVLSIMRAAGLDERLKSAYPHELDGGRRQRIGIARALATEPKFIVCDEPVSALDVSIRAQILNLMLDLQREHGLTYMFISHDLTVVRYMCDDVMVMYLGEVVEKCSADELFTLPLHPYTKALIASELTLELSEFAALEGEPVSPIDPGEECRFIARCPHACDECRKKQELINVNNARAEHLVRCRLATKQGEKL